MNSEFLFGWLKSAASIQKAFKNENAGALFADYLNRISHYSKSGIAPLASFQKETGTQLWICHTGPSAKSLTSEALAAKLEKIRDGGVRRFAIAIGGPDGFTSQALQTLRPEFQWSFGPMTLPHELAAVVAAEQIYRAWTILHHLPYHKGH
jgi:23S rRNA (pseudouridine1915-N3)-methyltransferase